MPVNAANDSFAAYLSKFLPLSHKLIVSFLLCCCTLWLSAQPEKWSDPASWQSGAVPGVFEKIVIPEGKSILLDISPAPVAELIIEGELIFDEQDINLIVGGIHLKGGLLQIGRKGTPFSHKGSLTLIQAPELEGGESKLQKKILISEGGLMRVCGANESPTWTRTKELVSPGDTLLTAIDSLAWPVDAEVVLASTGFSPEETESGIIYNQYLDHMSLSAPLEYMHTADISKKRSRTLDQRAEIGLLSHNVIIQGDQGAAYNQKGPIIRIKDKGRIQVEGAEFRFLGNKENMDGMAICFEEEQADTISFIKNSSLHHFGNRGILVKAGQKLSISNNVFYKMTGNGIIMNSEEKYPSSIRANLILQTRDGSTLFQDDKLPPLSTAGIWLAHGGYNVYKNIVAGTEKGSGFYIHDLWKEQKGVLGRRFIGNVAHGNFFEDVENALNPEGNAGHGLHLGIPETDSITSKALITDFVAYRNSVAGIWADVAHLEVKESLFQDNLIGLALPSAKVEDCMFIGSTNGTTRNPLKLEDGPNAIRFRGAINAGENIVVCKSSFQDYPMGSIFVQHPSIALLAVLYELSWINSTPIYYDDLLVGGMVDLDGSTTGGRGMIVGEDLSLQHSQCEFVEAWNAYTCELEPYLFMQLQQAEGETLPEWELSGLYGKVISRHKGASHRQSSFLISNSLYQLKWKESSPQLVVLDLEGTPDSYLQLSLAYPEEEEVWLEIDEEIYLPSYRRPDTGRDRLSYRWLEELQALDVFVRLGKRGKEKIQINRAKKAPFGAYSASLEVKKKNFQFRFSQKEIKDIASYQLQQKKEDGKVINLEKKNTKKKEVVFDLTYPKEEITKYRVKIITKEGQVFLSPWLIWGGENNSELSLK